MNAWIGGRDRGRGQPPHIGQKRDDVVEMKNVETADGGIWKRLTANIVSIYGTTATSGTTVSDGIASARGIADTSVMTDTNGTTNGTMNGTTGVSGTSRRNDIIGGNQWIVISENLWWRFCIISFSISYSDSALKSCVLKAILLVQNNNLNDLLL